MASAYLSRTSASPTNALKFTYSFWVKLSALENDTFLLDFNTDGNNRSNIGFETASKQFIVYEKVSGSTHQIVATSRLFRDPSAWYHIVASCDKTLATASDRTKIYVNGVRETSLSQTTYPAQNTTGIINTAVSTLIGKYSQGSLYLDGSLTHVHFVDGTAYAASDFGETDSTSGIWKPKTAPSVTYGNNGFFLKFENSGAMGTDSSGNSNTFTVNGTLTQNVDTPSNNFATWNPLSAIRIVSGTAYNPTFSNGNTTANHASGTYYTSTKSSLGVSSGKWYAEVKCSTLGSQSFIGLAADDDYGEIADTYTYRDNGTVNGSAYGNTYTSGDIIQIAFDATNGTVWFGKNGTWENSATQTEIENGTTTNAAVSGLSMTKFYHFATKGYNGSFIQLNAGSGFFGTTAVASANADGNGFGAFEYAVPSGYYALCTKNIKEFG